MKMLLNEKTKQEKIMNEVQKKRNLFGLGLTSLIAACGAADSAADSATDNTDNTDDDTDNTDKTTENLSTIPTKNLEAVALSDDTGSVTMATVGTIASSVDGGVRNQGQGATSILDAQITVTPDQRGLDSGADDLTLRIANGNHNATALKASVYTGLTATDKHDLVVSSYLFGDVDGTAADIAAGRIGAIYIFWDIGSINSTDIPADDAAAKTLAQDHLKIEGFDASYTISSSLPKFYHIGGVKDDKDKNQYDMVFQSNNGHNILWDVTQHAGATIDDLKLGVSPGILQIKGAMERLPPDFVKINNNEAYDVILTGSVAAYILWDVANYYDANVTNTISVNLAAADAETINATHGLLTIKTRTEVRDQVIEINIMKAKGDDGNDNGFTDIDGGGINDIALISHTVIRDSGDISVIIEETYISYILFGEKVADIDKDSGKAISHTVDVVAVAAVDLYNKDGTKDADATKGFFHYDFDDNDMIDDVEKNVGYRFATTTDPAVLDTLAKITDAYKIVDPTSPAEGGGTLSEEVYWDIA